MKYLLSMLKKPYVFVNVLIVMQLVILSILSIAFVCYIRDVFIEVYPVSVCFVVLSFLFVSYCDYLIIRKIAPVL